MDILIIWSICFGFLIGSFLNVCIYRIPLGKSILFPGSACTECNCKIPWYFNIPIFSYLILMGRCKYCKNYISVRYVFVELLSGLITGGLIYVFFVNGNISLETVIMYILLSYVLIIISFIDFEHLIVPNVITYSGIIFLLVISIVFPETYYFKILLNERFLNDVSRIHSFVICLTGMSISGGTVFITSLIGRLILKKEVMGLGDAKLMCVIGGIIGWKLGIAVFFVAPFFGLCMAIPMMIIKKTRVIPYAPFLSMAAILIIFFQDYFNSIIKIYSVLFDS